MLCQSARMGSTAGARFASNTDDDTVANLSPVQIHSDREAIAFSDRLHNQSGAGVIRSMPAGLRGAAPPHLNVNLNLNRNSVRPSSFLGHVGPCLCYQVALNKHPSSSRVRRHFNCGSTMVTRRAIQAIRQFDGTTKAGG